MPVCPFAQVSATAKSSALAFASCRHLWSIPVLGCSWTMTWSHRRWESPEGGKGDAALGQPRSGMRNVLGAYTCCCVWVPQGRARALLPARVLCWGPPHTGAHCSRKLRSSFPTHSCHSQPIPRAGNTPQQGGQKQRTCASAVPSYLHCIKTSISLGWPRERGQDLHVGREAHILNRVYTFLDAHHCSPRSYQQLLVLQKEVAWGQSFIYTGNKCQGMEPSENFGGSSSLHGLHRKLSIAAGKPQRAHVITTPQGTLCLAIYRELYIDPYTKI